MRAASGAPARRIRGGRARGLRATLGRHEVMKITTRKLTLPWTRCIVIALVGTTTLAAEATDRLENPTAGIVVVKPTGWHVGTIQQVEANRAKVRMNDEELQKAIQQSASAPLFVFTRYPEPYDGLNPSIQVALRPLGPLVGRTPVEIMQVAVGPLKKAFKGK